MYTRVTRNQFQIRDGVITHKPTQAEFTPNSNHEDSLLIYTGRIGRRLETGERFEYAEVLRMMRRLWREMSLTDARVELIVDA
jgi:hypothetical protein